MKDRSLIVEVDDVRARTPEAQVRSACMAAWARVCRSATRAVLLCGPPGAGKSTWLEQHQEPGVAYYDGTCTWPATRAQLARIAAQEGVGVVVVVFTADLPTCLARNAQRTGARRVDEGQIARQWHEMREHWPTATSRMSVRVA